MVRVRHCLFSPFPLPFLSFSYLFLYSSFSFSPPFFLSFFLSFFVSFSAPFPFVSFPFPFALFFPFLFLSLSFSFLFPFPLPFLFFPFPSFTIPFPFPFPRPCEFFDQGVKLALRKTIRGKKKVTSAKTIWKGSGFLQDLTWALIPLYIDRLLAVSNHIPKKRNCMLATKQLLFSGTSEFSVLIGRISCSTLWIGYAPVGLAVAKPRFRDWLPMRSPLAIMRQCSSGKMGRHDEEMRSRTRMLLVILMVIMVIGRKLSDKNDLVLFHSFPTSSLFVDNAQHGRARIGDP